MPHTFAGKLDRSTKRSRARTAAESTPIAIRGNVPVSARIEQRIRAKLGRRLGHAAPLIERGTVRFEDVNGPRGGVDTICRIKLVVSGRPSVHAQDRARDVEPAFDLALTKLERGLERVRGKHGLAAGRSSRRTGGRARAASRTATKRTHTRPASRTRAARTKARSR